jgi:cysteine synthase A
MTIMKAYGPAVSECPLPPDEIMKHLPEAERGMALWAACKKKCYDLEKSDDRVWWADQITNPDNTAAHRDTTGKEILDQIDGGVDVWTTSVGSGATLLGVAQALREENPNVRVIALQPTDFPVIDWTAAGLWQKWIQRLEFSYPKTIVQTMLETGLPDETINVRDEDARKMANRLCSEEGLFCGMSSGANVFAAIQVAKKLGKDQNVVTVLVDRRDRYLGEHPDEHYVV